MTSGQAEAWSESPNTCLATGRNSTKLSATRRGSLAGSEPVPQVTPRQRRTHVVTTTSATTPATSAMTAKGRPRKSPRRIDVIQRPGACSQRTRSRKKRGTTRIAPNSAANIHARVGYKCGVDEPRAPRGPRSHDQPAEPRCPRGVGDRLGQPVVRARLAHGPKPGDLDCRRVTCRVPPRNTSRNNAWTLRGTDGYSQVEPNCGSSL